MTARVLILPHTCRRDSGAGLVLKGFLEKMNHKAQVTSIINYQKWLKYWNPDFLVIFTPGKAKKIKSLRKNIKIIFVDGEAFQLTTDHRAKLFLEDKEEFDSLDMILVGSELIKKEFGERGLDISKIHVVGDTRFDIVKYFMRRKEKSKRKDIGFSGSFPKINQHQGDPVIKNLFMDRKLKYAVASLYEFNLFFKALIYILKNTDYNISLRPHPNESSENYEKFIIGKIEKKFQKRLSIDTSLDYAIWASSLKCIVSSSSTSIIQATLVGTPVLNLSKMAGQQDYWNNHSSSMKNCNETSTMLKDFEDLKKKMDKAKPVNFINKKLMIQLKKFCDWDNNEYASYRIAELISNFSKSIDKNVLRLPTIFIKKMEHYFFKKAMKKNTLIQNFNYCEFYHKNSSEFLSLVNERMETNKS